MAISDSEQEWGESWLFLQRVVGCIQMTSPVGGHYTATLEPRGHTQTRKWPVTEEHHQTVRAGWRRTPTMWMSACSWGPAGSWYCGSSCEPGCPGCRWLAPSPTTGTSTPRTATTRSTTWEWSRRCGTDAAEYLTFSDKQQQHTHTHIHTHTQTDLIRNCDDHWPPTLTATHHQRHLN